MSEQRIVTPEMLQSMTRATFDIECLRDVSKPFGFDNAEFLGIACACTINHEGVYKDFVEDISAFRCFGYLNKHQMIVGYNTIGFDFPLLGGSLLTPENPYSKRYVENSFKGRMVDLAKDFSEALGHRVKLESVSIPTLGDHKEMQGGYAPQHWRNGKCMEVIEYCRGDVRRTDQLLIKAVMGEELLMTTKTV